MSSNTIRTALAAALFVCTARASCLAQTRTGSVSGIIVEKSTAEVVIGATVRLVTASDSSHRVVAGASTNRFGYYTITDVPPGGYRLLATFVGYSPAERTIVIGEDSLVQRVDLTMAPTDVQGREVVVSESSAGSEASSISRVELRPDFIRKLPSIGGETDIFRALQLLPGVKASSEISSGLYVRGGSPDQNLVLLDGVIVYNPSHLGGFLSTFNSDAVRDIRLIKGAFPAEYGGRLSSVLDITMREGNADRVSGTAGISLINSRLTLEGPIGSNMTFMVSGRRMYLDLLTALAPDSDEIPRYYFYDLNAKINYRLSADDRLYLSGYFGRDVLDAPPNEQNQFGIDWGNATGNLRWMHVVSPELFTNFSLIYTDYDFSTNFQQLDISYGPNGEPDTLDRAGFGSISRIRDVMGRAEAEYAPHPDHQIKAGIEATAHRFRADATADFEDITGLDFNPTVRSSLDLSVYAQDEWQIVPTLKSNIGARLYWFQSGDYLRLEPRLSLSWHAAPSFTLNGAFSLGNQFLHLVSRNDISLPTDVWFPSTDSLLPAEAWQAVVGADLLFGDDYLFTVEGYYKSMRNLLEYKDTASFSLDAPIETSFTRGTGEAYGVEVFLNKRLGDFTGWIGYTLAWTRRTFAELNNGRPFYPRYDRRHDISVVMTYRLGENWELGATWVYGTGQAYTVASGQYFFRDPFSPYATDPTAGYDGSRSRVDYTERNGYRLPPFHKLDLNFSHYFHWFDFDWTLSLNLYNAYFRQNVFAQYMEREYDWDNPTAPPTYKMKRISLFPFIPSLGLSCKF